jgi:hypothetical protein
MKSVSGEQQIGKAADRSRCEDGKQWKPDVHS